MAPQVYITMYKEQFASPGRTTREPLRPTSANRRNNPQPRPDFLFPRNLQSNYRSHRMLPHASPPVDSGRPLFPPVRHLSFHSPLTTCPDNYLNTVDTSKPKHTSLVKPSSVQALPSADGLRQLQLTEPPVGPRLKLHTMLRSPERLDHQRNVPPLSARQLRQPAGVEIQARPQTSNPPATQRQFPQTRFRSSSIQNYRSLNGGCYSCFHVVKPYQAGHYIIHPEFVSECLR